MLPRVCFLDDGRCLDAPRHRPAVSRQAVASSPPMNPDPSESKALLRVQCKNSFVCAAFFLVGIVLYCVVDEDITWPLLALQLGCSASFAGLGVALGRGWMSPQ